MAKKKKQVRQQKGYNSGKPVSSYRAKQDMKEIYDMEPLRPKNGLQREYMNAIYNHTIVVGTGVAGSGKTFIAATIAADMLIDNSSSIEKIVISRPNQVEGTTSIGLLPGDINEKMGPWVAPVADAIKARIGASRFEFLLELGAIEIVPLEFIKGRTFNNTFVIVDEAEDIEYDVLKTLMLRTGLDSKLVIDGDVRQKSLKSDGGLTALLNIFKHYENLPMVHVDFPTWDYCVRSKAAAILGELFEEAESELNLR